MNLPPRREQGPAVPTLLREINERRILDVLRSNGSLHAAEIARLVGLSKPTTAALLRGLIEVGLVSEETPGVKDSKRARAVYSSVADAGVSLGIDFGAKFLRAALADLNGKIRAETSIEIGQLNLRTLLAALNKAVDYVLAESGFTQDHIASIVVGTPGVVDRKSGKIAIAGTIGDLDGIKLGEVIAKEYGVTPIIENDINLIALAEMEGGVGTGVNDFAVLSVGSGLGSGLVLNGKLHRGHKGAAGEIFYVPFGDPFDNHHASTDPATAGVITLAENLAKKFPKSEIARPYTPAKIFEAARQGDALGRAIVAVEAERIALYIASISAVVDVELIILAGGIGRNGDLLIAPIKSLLDSLIPFPPRIESTSLGDSAVLAGALRMATRNTQELIFRDRSSSIEVLESL